MKKIFPNHKKVLDKPSDLWYNEYNKGQEPNNKEEHPMKKCYKVVCERGHVGTGYSATITFYFLANNLLEAMDRGRSMGGVKHSRLPLSCTEIPYEEYKKGRETNAYLRAGAKKHAFG